ncbi:MAG: hypothetical protein KA715_00780 [Xanthomonadaceae bacterium]|nr:hypothetical protein [Xanthomonadaceae bacterium]
MMGWAALTENVDSFFGVKRIEKKETSASFYIAEDPFSSAQHGNIQIKIEMDPNAVVVGGSPSSMQNTINQNFPYLSHCWDPRLSVFDKENSYYNLI